KTRSLLRFITLHDEANFDRAHDRRGAIAFAETHLAVREFADLLPEVAHRRGLAGKGHLHAGGWIEPALLPDIADRAHHIDERAEAFLESEVAFASLGPRRHHERWRVARSPGALPELQRDRL